MVRKKDIILGVKGGGFKGNGTGELKVKAEEQLEIIVDFLASAVPFFATRSRRSRPNDIVLEEVREHTRQAQEEARHAQEEAQQAREQAKVAQEKILDYECGLQMLEKYVQSQPSRQEDQHLEVDA
ncbi:hypothetical protein ACLB2K_036701 [Fragaria x ananassa]